jgi:hypothetical protein
MTTNPALYGISFIFKFDDFLTVFGKHLALFCGMALYGLLKCPSTFFYFFCMFLKAVKW